MVIQPGKPTPRQRKRSGAHTIEKDDGTTYRRNAKRLTDGRGSIFFDKRRKRSPWIAQLPPVDGKIEKRSFATRDEADAWRQQQMALRDKGIRPLRDQTLGWWLDHWYRTRVVGHKKAKTVDLYDYLIRLHIVDSPLAKLPLAKIKPEHLREFYATVCQ